MALRLGIDMICEATESEHRLIVNTTQQMTGLNNEAGKGGRCPPRRVPRPLRDVCAKAKGRQGRCAPRKGPWPAASIRFMALTIGSWMTAMAQAVAWIIMSAETAIAT